MLLISHAAVGVAIARAIPYPVVSLPLSFLSHFVLDMIPHSHCDTDSKYVPFQAAVDTILTTLFLIFVFQKTQETNLIYGGVAGMVMDMDAVFYSQFVGKARNYTTKIVPDFISRFHGRIQNETKSIWGSINTFLIFLLSIAIIYAFR